MATSRDRTYTDGNYPDYPDDSDTVHPEVAGMVVGFREGGHTIRGYKHFVRSIHMLEKMEDLQPMFLLFLGNNDPATGMSWSGPCRLFEGVWATFKIEHRLPARGYLIRVYCGSEFEWSFDDCRFHHPLEPRLLLRTLPTLIKWIGGIHGGPRLDFEDLENPQTLARFLRS